MHELSLATEIVEAAATAAADSGAAEVTTVHVALDPASHLDREVLAEAFAIAATGTPVSGAVLQVTTGSPGTGELAVTAIDVSP